MGCVESTEATRESGDDAPPRNVNPLNVPTTIMSTSPLAAQDPASSAINDLRSAPHHAGTLLVFTPVGSPEHVSFHAQQDHGNDDEQPSIHVQEEDEDIEDGEQGGVQRFASSSRKQRVSDIGSVTSSRQWSPHAREQLLLLERAGSLRSSIGRSASMLDTVDGDSSVSATLRRLNDNASGGGADPVRNWIQEQTQRSSFASSSSAGGRGSLPFVTSQSFGGSARSSIASSLMMRSSVRSSAQASWQLSHQSPSLFPSSGFAGTTDCRYSTSEETGDVITPPPMIPSRVSLDGAPPGKSDGEARDEDRPDDVAEGPALGHLETMSPKALALAISQAMQNNGVART